MSDRIVEVGVYKVCPNEKPVSVVRRVNPAVPIPAAATKVHGITDADVADCRPFPALARKLVRFLDGCDLAGFGIKKFDLPILVAECRRAGVHFPLTGRAVIDALQIYHQRERRTLASALAFYVGVKHDRAHQASEDARASALVLDAQLKRYRDLPRTVGEHREWLGYLQPVGLVVSPPAMADADCRLVRATRDCTLTGRAGGRVREPQVPAKDDPSRSGSVEAWRSSEATMSRHVWTISGRWKSFVQTRYRDPLQAASARWLRLPFGQPVAGEFGRSAELLFE